MAETAQKTRTLKETMQIMGQDARAAAKFLATASADRKHAAFVSMAEALQRGQTQILAGNQLDISAARSAGISAAFLDRLTLDAERIRAMIDGILTIADLRDPVGDVMDSWTRPNGLKINRVRTPLGVIGVIYESRPNVTADAGALCLKAGNAVILRGGSDSFHSSRAIHACLQKGLRDAGLPAAAIQLVPTTDRAAVGEMLAGLDGAIDVIVPRGGKSLVARVQEEARVPVFAHLEGLCHLYVHPSSDIQMAVDLTVNSKLRRTGICGAAETLLVDNAAVSTHLLPILEALTAAGCEIRGDRTVMAAFPGAVPASDADWQTEYLAPIISVRVVDDIDAAIAHIETHGSQHTDAIFAEDAAAVQQFFRQLDSAILLHNASTQFADGAEFGMGAEIGIATGKMHARGPVGVEQLTSFQYQVEGSGQARP